MVTVKYTSPTAHPTYYKREAKGNEETRFGAAERFDYLVESCPALQRR
jgi:hypothetical protein